MTSRFLNLDRDGTLAANSDELVPSQKAIKTYADNKVLFYGTSTSAAADTEKVVSIPSVDTLSIGTIIIIKPTITSTVANSTIKLNNFNAYPMRYNNAEITTSTDSIVWNAAYPSIWVFDGTYWVFAGHGVDSNTTYSAMSVAEGTAGTATSSRVIRADYLKQIIQNYLANQDVMGGATASADGSKGLVPAPSSGDNLKFLRGDGTWAAAGGSANIDNKSITQNNDSQIQTIGVIDQNSGNAIKKWDGTKAQYDAITTKDSNTEYTTTDENDGQPIVIDNVLSSSSENPVQNKVIKTALDAKQATISDLSTIRSGAALGATAVQPIAIANMLETTDVTSSYSPTGTDPVNGTAIASALESVATVPLFYYTFADHLFSDTSWLRADTFSWQDGSVYKSAYQHLVDDYAQSVPVETDVINGITIYFKRASDGHKVCHPNQESALSNLYNATGVAWYYLLDTANTRFKLPRMLPLGDTAPVVGNGIALGLSTGTQGTPTIAGLTSGNTGGAGNYLNTSSEALGQNIGTSVNQTNRLTQGLAIGVTTDSTKSGLIANLSHTTNDGSYKYLYFYVGNTVQGQTTIDVGQITETLNGKADLDLANVSATGKATAIGWGMPDYDSGITIALRTTGVTYTPSFPGVIRVYRAANDGLHYIRVYKGTSSSGIILQEYSGASQFNTGYNYAYIPVSALETYFIICNTLSVVNAVFFPFKGAN